MRRMESCNVEVMREVNNFSGVLLRRDDGSAGKRLCSFQAKKAQENFIRLGSR